MNFPATTTSNSPLLTLPNELFLEVASHLESFKDLNSLLRTTRFFHNLLNSQLYRRAVAVDDPVRQDIVRWVLSQYLFDSLELLLDNGLSVHQKLGEDSEPLLKWICWIDNCDNPELSVRLAALLIERGADMTEQCPGDFPTPLHVASWVRNCGLAAVLLANGADVNAAATNEDRRTPLHSAVQEYWSDRDIIDLLIEHGAAVDARDSREITPLLLAASMGNASIIPALLRHGADARACDVHRNTPLHYLESFRDDGDHEVAKLLLEHGADVNAANDRGYTPLHWASDAAPSDDALRNVKFLLENGADVNASPRDGHSPLKVASYNVRWCRRYKPWKFAYRAGCEKMMSLLIAHGADASVLNSVGDTDSDTD
jgi:ankyrin repeat protein